MYIRLVYCIYDNSEYRVRVRVRVRVSDIAVRRNDQCYHDWTNSTGNSTSTCGFPAEVSVEAFATLSSQVN